MKMSVCTIVTMLMCSDVWVYMHVHDVSLLLLLIQYVLHGASVYSRNFSDFHCITGRHSKVLIVH